MTKKPLTIEDIRAAVAKGTEEAARVFRANADLRGASELAERMEKRAKELRNGASMRPR